MSVMHNPTPKIFVFVGSIWMYLFYFGMCSFTADELQSMTSSRSCSCSSLYVTKRSGTPTSSEESPTYNCKVCRSWQNVSNILGEYMVPEGTYTFNQSRRVCQACGGDVIVVQNATNLVFSLGTIMDAVASKEDELFIGIVTNEEDRSLFEWMDGRPFNSSDGAWDSGQPNDRPAPQDCTVTIRKRSWKLHDRRCFDAYNTICQKPAY